MLLHQKLQMTKPIAICSRAQKGTYFDINSLGRGEKYTFMHSDTQKDKEIKPVTKVDFCLFSNEQNQLDPYNYMHCFIHAMNQMVFDSIYRKYKIRNQSRY